MVRPKKHYVQPYPSKCQYKKSIRCKDDSGKFGLTLSECLYVVKKNQKNPQYSFFLYRLVLAAEMRKVTFDVKRFIL